MVVETVQFQQVLSERERINRIQELRISGLYSDKDIRQVAHLFDHHPQLTQQEADKIVEALKNERSKTISDYVTDAFLHLLEWSDLLADKDPGGEPSTHLGQKITGATLNVVAESVLDPAGGNVGILEQVGAVNRTLLLKTGNGIKALFAYIMHRFPGSAESAAAVGKNLEALSADEASEQSRHLMTETFIDVVRHWWVRKVGRPVLIKNKYPEGTPRHEKKDEKLIQPNTGDKKMQEDGYFTFGDELYKNTEFWEYTLRLAWLDLRDKVIEDRALAEKMEAEGKVVTVTPWPMRYESGYTIIFDAGPDGQEPGIKVNVSLDAIQGDFRNFNNIVRSHLYSARYTEVYKKMNEEEQDEQVIPRSDYVKPISKFRYKLAKLRGLFRQLYHHESVQKDLFDLSSPYAADLRFCVQRLGVDTTVAAVQDNFRFDPMGARISTTYIMGFAGVTARKVHTTNSHIFDDGARRRKKQLEFLYKAAYGNPDNNLEVDRPKDLRTIEEIAALLPDKRDVQEMLKVPEYIEAMDIEPELLKEGLEQVAQREDLQKNPYALPSTKTMQELGGIIKATSQRETKKRPNPKTRVFSLKGLVSEGEGNIVESLFASLDKKDPDSLYSFYKKRFGISITPALGLNLALMRALGLKETQFLDVDKADNTLGPVIMGLPPVFAHLLENKKYRTPGFMLNSSVNKVVGMFRLFEKGRKMFWEDPSTFKPGMGSPETLDVVAGVFKGGLSLGGDIMAGEENNKLQKTVLVSILLEDPETLSQETRTKGVRTREFTTSIGEPHAEMGSFGMCQNTTNDIRVSYRRGKRDIVAEKFGNDENTEKRLRKAMITSLYEIFEVLYSVRKHVEHQDALQAAKAA